MAKNKRITILCDDEEDRDLIDYLEADNVSNSGRQLLKVAMVLQRADLVETIEFLQRKGIEEKQGSVKLIAKALSMANIMDDDATSDSSKRTMKKPALFADGDR
ncbi:hypothetical protein GCM10023116_16110 [Kistimonas scapharcae]|uniref:Uncharacterized protein n=1 Tax=Kistimonas scapharcae TaxID=1036133 RepID=A0ABP8V3B4_9GAMM